MKNNIIKGSKMTKEKALKMLKLLSALESWAFTLKEPMPEYLREQMAITIGTLEEIILGDDDCRQGGFTRAIEANPKETNKMTKDDIINMAMNAEFCYEMEFPYLPHHDSISVERGGQNIFKKLVKFADLVAAHEREMCAKVCDGWDTVMADRLATAIRVRGDVSRYKRKALASIAKTEMGMFP